MLILNKSLGSMFSVDISKRFINEFPKGCPLSNYKITKVVSNNEEVKNYQSSLAITSKGILLIQSTAPRVFSNY